MSSGEMDTRAYLSRIGFSGPAEATLDVLRSLHTCHLLSVPFESLTVHSGGRVQLDPPLLFDKIVNRRRGGFCYELNGLFSWLLRELGFQVTVLSGQVKDSFTGCYGPPFDHLVVMVTLDGQRWLCDVGFGSQGPFAPLSLETSGPQEQGHRLYRVRPAAGGTLFMEIREENRGWEEQFKFTLQPRRLEDFTEMCRYHQSSPSSFFFCKSFCSVLKPGARLTYMGRRLISTAFPTEGAGLQTTTRELKEEEISKVLAEEFGIVLNSPLIPKDDDVTPTPLVN